MKKLILFMTIAILLLSGCGEESKTIGTLENVKVYDKRVDNICARCSREYYVTFDKEGEQVQLNADEKYYKALQKGTIADVGYNENYYIKKVSFPNIEMKPKVEPEFDNQQH